MSWFSAGKGLKFCLNQLRIDWGLNTHALDSSPPRSLTATCLLCDMIVKMKIWKDYTCGHGTMGRGYMCFRFTHSPKANSLVREPPTDFKNVIVSVMFAILIPLGIPRCNCN